VHISFLKSQTSSTLTKFIEKPRLIYKLQAQPIWLEEEVLPKRLSGGISLSL
jgi:hypothetical protein